MRHAFRQRLPATRTTLALWAALALPSLYVVDKIFGGIAAFVYVLAVGSTLFSFKRAGDSRSASSTWSMRLATLATIGVVVAMFCVVYPMADVHAPGAGSDDDDAHDIGAHALLSGRSPYEERTYLENVLHQLPGSFVLAAPFAWLGHSAWQNVFWLGLFFVCVAREARDERFALRLAWLVLLASPVVMHQIVTGTTHCTNTIYVLLGLWWLSRGPSSLPVASAAWGLTLASRLNFVLLVPIAFGWLWQHHGKRAASTAIAVACVVLVASSAPFFSMDPEAFGPMEASSRLQRFDAVIPQGGMLVGLLMASLAVLFACLPMSRAELFRNCAVVQAIPIAADVVRSVLLGESLDLAYLVYGVFFAAFVLMAYAIDHGAAASTDTAS